MLSDFLLLEEYYEAPETIRMYEDCGEQYGFDAVHKAIRAGYLACKTLSCKRNYDAALFKARLYLTQQGRKAALKNQFL